ncbi:GNAT family N-acetyltransferase [Halalkalibacillus sediminis]|uniref:GNAT family N-acetyltransferase n=1 Tax=Halalkalibacillus sediminis TaxID=2018042 RepID=A0A2I0QR94_9BACI|nr:N-acetyltransferase [Halalkalibacillus sediminis]PKR76857.1 GNAT family N-acetyltransferase [Halalkalibacillus sediminis]
MNITIRQETPNDYQATEKVVEAAFKNAEFTDHDEHNLVARLRKSEAFVPQLSLVAEDDNQLVGHIMLSRIRINSESKSIESLALAPVSVLPDYQGKGIGKELIMETLNQARILNFKSVIVLGHPEYYKKLGFRNASLWGIKAPFDVPDDAFMALELEEKSLADVTGVVQYPEAFSG